MAQYRNSKRTTRLEETTEGDVVQRINNKLTGTKEPTVDALKLSLETTPICEEGVISWSVDGGTAQIGMPGGSVCLQLGQEQLIRATNKSGDIISNGTPVYISGAAGSNIYLDVADAGIPDNNRKTLAVATEDILDNQKGYVTTFGFVRDINTNLFTEGEELFVAVGGGLTNIKPSLPNGVVRVGYCTRKQNEEGSIFVTIDAKSVKDILTDSGDLTIKTASGYTQVLEQPVYKDWNLGAGQLSLAASAQPAIDTFVDKNGADTGIESRSFGVGDRLCGVTEVNHEYKEQTNLKPHFHFQAKGTPTGTDKIKMQLKISVAHMVDEITPLGVIEPAVTTTVEVDISTPNTVYTAGFPDFDATGLKIGSQLLYRLERVAASADEFSGGVLLMTYGKHYQIDTNGSRQVFLK